MSSKAIRITDYVTIPFGTSRMTCPINRIMFTEKDLKRVFMSERKPVHIYAINPNDPKETVLLTKDNYMKTNEELFGAKKVEEPTTKTETFKINVGESINSTPIVEEDKPEPIIEEPAVAEPIVEDVIEEAKEEVSAEQEVIKPAVAEEPVEEVKSEESTEVKEEIVETIVEEKKETSKAVNNNRPQNNSYNGYVRQNKKRK